MNPPTPPQTPVPSSPPPASGKIRPWHRVAAVGAALLLVAAGLVIVMPGPPSAGELDARPKDQAAYTADALDSLGDLADLGEAGSGAAREAALAAQQAQAAGEQALAAAIADAQARFDAALSALQALPQVPEGYLPGADVKAFLPVPAAPSFPLPSLHADLTVGDFAAVKVDASGSPVKSRDGLHAPSTGQAPVDDLVAQLLDAYSSLRDVAELLEGTLPADPTGLGLPVDLLDGLPVSGLPVDGLAFGPAPGQVQDANDAIDPDEDGALSASAHAQAVVGLTTSAYGNSQKSLSALLHAYQGLAEQVEDLVADIQAKAEAGEVDIQARLDALLAQVKADEAAAKQQALAMVAAHTKAVESAAAEAEGALKNALDARVAATESALGDARAALSDRLAKLEALADARKVQVQVLAEAAVSNLTRMQAETGLDASARIASVRAAAAQALVQVESELAAQSRAIEEMSVKLEAQARSAVAALTETATASGERIEATVKAQAEAAQRAQAFLVGAATAHATMVTDLAKTGAVKATADLKSRAAAEVNGLMQTALELTGSTEEVLDATGDLVDEVSALATGHVQTDVDYILKVAGDYSKIPTSERKAKADYWASIGAAGDDAIGTIVETGDDLEALAFEVSQAAAQARVAVLAML